MSERNPRAAWLVPAKDLPKRPPMDLSPLSEDEKAELQARLNAPGGSRTTLNPREYQAWSRMTVVRSAKQIADLVMKVQAESRRSSENGRQYAGGILDAVAWATGHQREAPITGSLPASTQPTVREMGHEARAAREVAHRERESIRPHDYAVGVEAALVWLRAEDEASPW